MSLFNLAPAVALLSNERVTIRRPAADSYDANGRATARTFTSIATNLGASIQPIRGNELMKLPEGERDVEWQTMYTSVAVVDGDYVTVIGKGEYQARSLADWQTMGAYTRVYLKRFNAQEPRS